MHRGGARAPFPPSTARPPVWPRGADSRPRRALGTHTWRARSSSCPAPGADVWPPHPVSWDRGCRRAGERGQTAPVPEGLGSPPGWASWAVPRARVCLPVPAGTLGRRAAPRLALSLVVSQGQSPAGTGQALEDGGRGRKGGPGTGPSPDFPPAPAVGTGGSLAAHTDEGLRWPGAPIPAPQQLTWADPGTPPAPPGGHRARGAHRTGAAASPAAPS